MRNKALKYRNDPWGYLPRDLFALMARAGERGWSITLKYDSALCVFVCTAARFGDCNQVCESSNAWSAISQVFTECIIPWEAEHAAREQKADAVLAQIVNFVTRGAKAQKAIDATMKKAEHAK